MRRFAQVIEKFRTTFTYNRPYDVQLLDTFAGASLKELDYINEASNQEEFRQGSIKVPSLCNRVELLIDI